MVGARERRSSGTRPLREETRSSLSLTFLVCHQFKEEVDTCVSRYYAWRMQQSLWLACRIFILSRMQTDISFEFLTFDDQHVTEYSFPSLRFTLTSGIYNNID